MLLSESNTNLLWLVVAAGLKLQIPSGENDRKDYGIFSEGTKESGFFIDGWDIARHVIDFHYWICYNDYSLISTFSIKSVLAKGVSHDSPFSEAFDQSSEVFFFRRKK